MLVPLFVHSGSVYILLTERSQHVSRDKGSVAFPGGMEDENETEVETCLRESEEEIGLRKGDVEILGNLPPSVVRGGVFVSVVLGMVDPDFIPAPNIEVSQVFSLPLCRFLDSHGHTSTDFPSRGVTFNIHYFDNDINGSVILTWGMTAIKCVQLAMSLFKEEPDFENESSLPNPFAAQLLYLERYQNSLLKGGHSRL